MSSFKAPPPKNSLQNSDSFDSELGGQYSLLAPGPVNLHPRVREVLSEPMMHHRIPAFDAILARVLKRLKNVFATEERVYLHTSTGTGGMESLLVNTLSRGDRVLAIVSGKFGERWAEMARIFGCDVEEIAVPWGEAVNPQIISEKLMRGNYKAVLCQACETSTGVFHPIKELGNLVSVYEDTLFLVDGITAVGAFPLPMDEWHIDGLVAGSQKAFMLPTGLSIVSFSQKAQKCFEKANLPRFYFDIRAEQKANAKGETFFSSNVILVKAMDVVLDLFEDKGIPALYAEIHRRAEMTRAFAQKQGMDLFAKRPSDSLTAIVLPTGVDSQKVRGELEKKDNITLMGGQDQAKGKILRIGHMGYITDVEMLNLFKNLTLRIQDEGVALPLNPNEIEKAMKNWIGEYRG
ncbi:MAG: alanine--glyoxylate aminotransferase family protein [Bdellovibrionota bacterium]